MYQVRAAEALVFKCTTLSYSVSSQSYRRYTRDEQQGLHKESAAGSFKICSSPART